MITTTILIQEMNTTMMMMICTMMTIMTTMIKEVNFIRCFLRSKEYKFINTFLGVLGRFSNLAHYYFPK